ncbi:MAG TPA: ankyrin repeat domain-containing protein [Opitutaceae bacterium]|nr:ankyrin repeat domain-containing protein [Opitutaceae bacterium]
MKGQETIAQGALTYNVVDLFGKTPALALARAAAAGSVDEVKKQIAAGVDPNTVGEHDVTPLWWAAWAQNLDGFRALLTAQANPNFRRREGFSIMILITRMKDPRFLELALQNGGDPNFRDVKPIKTPIFEAVMYSDADRQRQLLLQSGADLNAQDGNGQTPMMAAIAARKDYKLVWDFLQRGADYRLKTNYKRTLADMIGVALIDPQSDQYLWREKVIEFLRSKGIEAHRPTNEIPRGQ